MNICDMWSLTEIPDEAGFDRVGGPFAITHPAVGVHLEPHRLVAFREMSQTTFVGFNGV
jgi:hypothetical protein